MEITVCGSYEAQEAPICGGRYVGDKKMLWELLGKYGRCPKSVGVFWEIQKVSERCKKLSRRYRRCVRIFRVSVRGVGEARRCQDVAGDTGRPSGSWYANVTINHSG